MDSSLRQAICRINARGGRGTGTLVSPRHVLTAVHVVADRRTLVKELEAGRMVTPTDAITLHFPDGHTTSATIVEGLFDPISDWVLEKSAVH